jgi:tetratricopeptide (TPR) repeat protein/tRNA A-37 threonylcarbamoyl transferase component Bud32
MNATNTCPDPERLRAFLLGLLPAAEVDALETHVSGCSPCVRALEGLNAEDVFLQAVHHGFQAGRAEVTPSDDPLIAQLCRLRAFSATDRAGDTVVDPEPEALAIAGYEVLQRLGAGGMGVVYKARHKELSRLVALKMIRGSAAADAEQLARFRREAQAAARLQHPNIVQVYEVGVCAGRPYLALEYLDGGSLAQQLTAGPRPARLAAELVATLARAVEAAHQQGVLHRDLKPANVLLTADGMPKVADFGLAKWLPGPTEEATSTPSQHTQSGALLGTPNYMAPEQALGKSTELGPAADVWALGAILYETLTGRPPFQAPTILETLEQVRMQEPVPPRRLQPKLSRDLEAICLKCLEKEPARRYRSAEALADDLERWRRGEPIAARPVSAASRAGRWCRRNPMPATLGGAAALLLATILATLSVSTILIWRAQQKTQEALEQEERARQEADANFRMACAVVNQELHQVQAKLLADVPQMTTVQRVLAENALKFYRDLPPARQSERVVRLGLAQAHVGVGLANRKLGQHAAAAAALDEGIAILDKLAADFPDVVEYPYERALAWARLGEIHYVSAAMGPAEKAYTRARELFQTLTPAFPPRSQCHEALADVQHDLATVLDDSGRSSEAIALYRQTLKLRQELVDQEPTASRRRHGLALTSHNLGVLLEATNDAAAAEKLWQRAVELHEQLVAEFPTVSDYRRELARDLTSLANLLRKSGRRAPAEAAYRRALVLRQRLAADFPDVPAYRQELAYTHNGLGLLYGANQRPAAEAAHGEALRLRQQLVKQHPTIPAYQSELASTLNNLALLKSMQGTLTEVRDLLREAVRHQRVAFQANPGNPTYRQFLLTQLDNLTLASLDLSEHAEAARLAEELPQVSRDRRQASYRAAGFLARCAMLAAQDKALSQAYGDRAVQLLRQAVQAGFRNMAAIQNDAAFAALRARPDFQHLLNELGATRK